MPNKQVEKLSGVGSTAQLNEQNGLESFATSTDMWLRRASAFREPPDEYNRDVTRAIGTELSYYRDLLFDLFEAAQLADRSRAHKLLEIIRDRKNAQQLCVFLHGMLANAGLSEMNARLIGHSFDAEYGRRTENAAPRARLRVMDIQNLCGTAPYRVPARPWTTVTNSDDLVSHLVSLYLTWGYPFYAFFCRETFLKHMRSGRLNSDFCSPFLVNALLANACFYSDYSEAYSLPGDVKMKGAHFLAEAEWHLKSHQFESGSDIRLASLQATLLLYGRYSMSRQENFGYTMLHRAISMAESMGIVNNARKLLLQAPHFSKDMTSSLKRTAWGLFQIDTIVHMNFLRQSHIKSVSVDHIGHDETPAEELWTPYPVQRQPRPCHMSRYFDEACKLSYIARDISWNMSCTHEDAKLKQEMYGRLRDWERELPRIFNPNEKPAPYIIILSMRYHTLVINLCCHDLQLDMSSMKTSVHNADMATSKSDSSAIKTALTSAHEIASLVQVYRTEFGLEYAHQFAMYAINVSLFCLLAQKAFDISDPDFSSLASAFSAIACRSQVGRHLFHAFKLSVRSRNKAGQMQSSEDTPLEIQELFGPREDLGEPDKWDRYAEGLADVDGEGSFLRELGMVPAVPGLHDMLRWYERLSVGQEIQWRGNGRDAEF